MKRSKIVLSVILVVVTAFALTACGTIDFTYVQNSDGTFTHTIKMTLTEEGVKSADVGLSLTEAVNAVKDGFIKNNYSVDCNGNTVTARKTFVSVEELRNDLLGTGVVVASGDNVKIEQNAFVVKQTSTGKIKVSNSYLENYKPWVAGILKGGNITNDQADKIALVLYKADTSYTFITPYESTTSNADSVTKTKDGKFAHVWKFDGGNDTAEITLMKIKGATWYGVAIMAGVCVFLIYVVTKEILSHKKTKA